MRRMLSQNMSIDSFSTNILRAWGFTLKTGDRNLHQLSIIFDFLFVDGGDATDNWDSMGQMDHGPLPLAWAVTHACDSLRLHAAGAGGQQHLAVSTHPPFTVIDSDGLIVAKEEC